MTICFTTVMPLVAAILAFVVAAFFFFRKKELSQIQRSLLFASPWVVLLQIGTFMLLAAESHAVKILGGNAVLWSFSILCPICTRLALLWGMAPNDNLLKRFRPALFMQWIVSIVFCAILPWTEFLRILAGGSGLVIALGPAGYYLMIYLIICSVMILSIFERRLRLGFTERSFRLPAIAYMAIFVFFIIIASQGLLIRTFNPNSLLLISVSIFLGYVFPFVLRTRNVRALNRVTESRETVYSSFMVLGVGAYLVLIGIAGKVIAAVGGDLQTFFSVIGGAAAILFFFVILLSSSVKLRVRKFIDRTFYGGKYDYRAIWARFGEETAFVQTLDELLKSILDNVTDFLGIEKGMILLSSSRGPQLVLAKKKMSVTSKPSSRPFLKTSLIGCGGWVSRLPLTLTSFPATGRNLYYQ